MIEQMSRSPRANSGDVLPDLVAEGLRRHCGVPSTARMVVAVSGGGDSVALLRALVALTQRGTHDLAISVGHVHHHLRGAESDVDADFVESLADELDLPFMRADVDVDAGAGGNVEAKARKLRYEALATMAEVFKAGYVVTAHHGDDQLETLLMRLLRGTSVEGLRGIAWRRELPMPAQRTQLSAGVSTARAFAERENNTATVHLIRPMLAANRRQVHGYLHALGQTWREDRTNHDVSRVRARLRHDVLPILEDVKPDAAQRAVVLADHVAEVAAVIAAEVDRWHEHVMRDVDRADQIVVMDRGEARLVARLVLIGLLRRTLIEAGARRDRLTNRTLMPLVRAIRDSTGGTRTFDLPGGVKAVVNRESIEIHPAPA